MDGKEPTIAELIGKEIRKARIESGFTQAELANRLNVTQQFVSGVERGACDCPERIIEELPHLINFDSLKACRLKETLPSWIIKGIAARTEEPNVCKAIHLIANGRELNIQDPPRRSYRRY